VLSNIVAGLTIIFTHPYRVGDFISIQKEEGEVLDVSLFSTVLGHPDLSRVVIPNRKIVGEILHNYGKLRQLDVEVGVAYDTDIGAALRSVEETLRANARVLQDPKPVIGVSRLAESQVRIAVKPWVGVPDFAPAGAEVTRAILEAFRSRNIVIPFPQREVRMKAA
jgi:small conductance mechanosensitive channel